MQKYDEEALENKAKKLSPKMIAVLIITALALLVQIAGLDKPHMFPFPPSVECEMVLAETSLDDGSSLIVDSQGKRMLFTNQQGQLIRVVETLSSNSDITRVLEATSIDGAYYVHGVAGINGGDYVSSESVQVYDAQGNFVEECYHQEYPDAEYVSSISVKFGELQVSGLYAVIGNNVHLDFSLGFFLRSLAFWLSIVWLAFVAICLIVRLVKRKWTMAGKAVLAVLAGIMITAGFYTAGSCQQILVGFEDRINTASTQVEKAVVREFSENELKVISEVGLDSYCSDSENREKLDMLNSFVSEIAKAYGKDQSIGISILSAASDGRTFIIADSRGPQLFGQETTLTDEEKQIFYSETFDGYLLVTTPCARALLETKDIVDEQGNLIAVVAVGSNVDNVLYSQITKALNYLFTLLPILIGVVVAISALKMCIDSIRSCLRRKTADLSERIAHLSGMYMLIFKLAYTVDQVLVVYIAGSLCEGLDPAMQAIFIAIPISLFYAGQWVGTFVATPLMKALGERRLALITCAASVLIMLFLASSVFAGNIVLYSIGRGLMGFAISGVLYVISGTLPLCAKTSETRTSAIESSIYGSTAAAILTALIGGYVSELLGYNFIYIAGAVMCVALFAMTIVTFGKVNFLSALDGNEDAEEATSAEAVKEKKKDKASFRKLWLVFLKPEFLMYFIFFSFPNMLTIGYSTYIFPLYASGSGITPVFLSNISVFALAAMYLLQKPIDRFARRFETTVMLVAPSLVICAGLLCFAISPNIYWAVAMVFVVSIFNYMTRVSETTYIADTAEKFGQKPTLVQSNCYTVDATMQIAQAPVLSAFVSMGIGKACVALGVACGIMYSVFGFFARGRKKKEHTEGLR